MYIRDLFKKFVMERKSHTQTSMSTSVKISSDSTSKCVNSTLYRSMIRSLFYITVSRLDISFNGGIGAKFQSNPKKSHLTTIKKNLKIPYYYNWL
jgi:hypothetical protein